MTEKFDHFTSLIKRRVYVILQDLWGFVTLIFTSWILKGDETTGSIFGLFSKEKFISVLEYWTGCENGTNSTVVKIAISTLLTTLFLSLLLSVLLFALHLYFPKKMKNISYLFLPFAVLYFKQPFENTAVRWLMALLASLLSSYELFKTSTHFEYCAYDLSRKNLKSIVKQKIVFYFKLLAQWPLMLIDVLCLRFSEFTGFNKIKICILLLYVLTFVYSNSYSLGSNLTIYYSSILMPYNTSNFTIFDTIYSYFNSRCFSIYKVINLCFSIPSTIYYTVRYKTFLHSYLSENTEISSYVCVLKRQSFLNFVLCSNQKFWYSDLKRKMKRINFREDMFASMAISWILIHVSICQFQKNFIRPYESFIIVFTHFNILIEIFNSFIFVLIFKSIYEKNPSNLDSNRDITTKSPNCDVAFVSNVNCEYTV